MLAATGWMFARFRSIRSTFTLPPTVVDHLVPERRFRHGRAPSRSVLPTIRSWVSTTASAKQHLPLDSADRENREAAVVRELAEPLGEVALPLPAQPRDPMWRDLVGEAFRNIEAPKMPAAVHQPLGVGDIAARLELPDPHEPRHAGVRRLFERMLEVAPNPPKPAAIPHPSAPRPAVARCDHHLRPRNVLPSWEGSDWTTVDETPLSATSTGQRRPPCPPQRPPVTFNRRSADEGLQRDFSYT